MLDRRQSERSFQSAMIIDDHPLFCDALSMTLKAVAGIDEIETATTLENAIIMLSDGSHPDLIVLDLNLPDVQGFDGLVRLRTASNVPVIVVSSMAENSVISTAIHIGAAGFIPKHSQRDVFRQAFEALRKGQTFIPDGFQLLPKNDVTLSGEDEVLERLSTLTNQQARILQLICEGKLNKQIAYDLSIAETTVKAHVTAIMRKLGVQSRTQAVLIAKQTSFANLLQNASQAS